MRNHIGGVLVLPSCVVDCGFEPQSCKTTDCKIKQATLRRKSKDWLAGNQENLSE